jgi:crotonobetainyl-CoA:carnitine CoA-transferase CaiB-like acyl-CoA transferase
VAGALDGIRVVECAEGVAGPYCGRLLAGLGADVLKIEPPGGDWTRREGPFPGDVPHPEKSGLFLHLNTGKRSAVMGDGGTPRSPRRRRRAAAGDAPGGTEGRAIDLDVNPARHPALVIERRAVRPATALTPTTRGELVEYAPSGYMMLTGPPGREPLKSYGWLVGYEAGHAAVGTPAALTARDRSGAGQIVDVSGMEAGTFMLGAVEQRAHFCGQIIRRNGTRPLIPTEQPYPSTIRPCRDGFVHCHRTIATGTCCMLIPNPRLLEPDLIAKMMGHADEIDAIMDEWLATRGGARSWRRRRSCGCPSPKSSSPAKSWPTRTIATRELRDGGAPVAGPILQAGAPMRMAPRRGDEAAPVLGSSPARSKAAVPRQCRPHRARGKLLAASACWTSRTRSPDPSPGLSSRIRGRRD